MNQASDQVGWDHLGLKNKKAQLSSNVYNIPSGLALKICKKKRIELFQAVTVSHRIEIYFEANIYLTEKVVSYLFENIKVSFLIT